MCSRNSNSLLGQLTTLTVASAPFEKRKQQLHTKQPKRYDAFPHTPRDRCPHGIVSEKIHEKVCHVFGRFTDPFGGVLSSIRDPITNGFSSILYAVNNCLAGILRGVSYDFTCSVKAMLCNQHTCHACCCAHPDSCRTGCNLGTSAPTRPTRFFLRFLLRLCVWPVRHGHKHVLAYFRPRRNLDQVEAAIWVF